LGMYWSIMIAHLWAAVGIVFLVPAYLLASAKLKQLVASNKDIHD
jgi:hypothetical protein